MPLNLLGSFVLNKNNRDSQYQHDVDMYNMQRKDYLADRAHEEQYNSPAAQVERLRAAGLNPSLAMSNIQTGQVNSSSSPNAQSSTAAVQTSNLMQGVLGMMDTKANLSLKQSQARDVAADAKLKEIQAEFAAQEAAAQISKLRGEARESWKRGDHIDSNASVLYNKMLSEIGVNASQNEINWAIHATKMKELAYLPIEKSLDWIEQVGRIMESASREQMNRQAIKKMIEETTAARFGWKDKEWQYNLNKKTESYIIDKIKADVWKGSSPVSWLGIIGNEARHLMLP